MKYYFIFNNVLIIIIINSHAFGVQQKIRDCIAFLDATHTIHPVGKYMAITSIIFNNHF